MKNFHIQNFHVKNKKTTIDFSLRKEFPTVITDSFKVSPIRWTSDYTLLRTTNSEKKIYFVYGTSGLPPDASCTTHPFKFYQVSRQNPLGHSRSNSYCVEVDISQTPVDSFFHIVIEEIEWNTNLDKHKGSDSFSNFLRADVLKILMIWPVNKNVHSIKGTTYPLQSKEETPIVFESKDSTRTFTWNIDNPIQGNCYRIYWEW